MTILVSIALGWSTVAGRVKFPHKLVPAIEPHLRPWIPSVSSTACNPLAVFAPPLRPTRIVLLARIKSPQPASYQIRTRISSRSGGASCRLTVEGDLPAERQSYSGNVAAPNLQRHNLSVGSAPRQSLVFCTGTNCSDVDNACPCEGDDENKYKMVPPIASMSTMKTATPPTNSRWSSPKMMRIRRTLDFELSWLDGMRAVKF